jgi:hypothetical protein
MLEIELNPRHAADMTVIAGQTLSFYVNGNLESIRGLGALEGTNLPPTILQWFIGSRALKQVISIATGLATLVLALRSKLLSNA